MQKIPQSVANEHHALHETLERASREQGDLGATARELHETLAPHFHREEEIATPPLSLLLSLATAGATADMRTILPLTEALERELPEMLREHEAIRAAAARFREAAEAAGRQDYVDFSNRLAAHAREEEELLYPAAILVGRYIALSAPKS